MADQYDSPEQRSSCSSPPISMWAKLPYTVPLSDETFAQGSYPFSNTLNAWGSDDYRNVATVSVHDQDGCVIDAGNGDAVYTSASSVTENCEVHVDRSYAPAWWEECIDGELSRCNERLSSGNTIAMEQNWAVAGYSPDVVLRSLSAGTRPDLAAELLYRSLARNPSQFNKQESLEMADLGNENLDDDGGVNNESEGQNMPFDSVRFESMWTEPHPCYLGGCRQGALFPTLQYWYSHVKNVHKKAVFCSVLECSHRRAFSNNSDLKRHIETRHERKKAFKCERPRCTRAVKAWPRKDKLRLHNKKYHSNFRCFFCSKDPRHQSWFDTSSELWEHTNSSHPDV